MVLLMVAVVCITLLIATMAQEAVSKPDLAFRVIFMLNLKPRAKLKLNAKMDATRMKKNMSET